MNLELEIKCKDKYRYAISCYNLRVIYWLIALSSILYTDILKNNNNSFGFRLRHFEMSQVDEFQ